jgi:hypothetical protein
MIKHKSTVFEDKFSAKRTKRVGLCEIKRILLFDESQGIFERLSLRLMMV